jgi:phosphatidylinositol alpha-1,6-mannosyltransferase
MVFIEAAACGKPSLAGMAGGTGAAVLHERTGLRVDGTSVSVIAASLQRLLTDQVLLQQLGKQAFERVEQQFAWQRTAQVTERLMD